MSNTMTSHPEPELLLQFADGELGGAARQEVFEHLSDCDECRTWLGELERGIADYSGSWMPLLRENSAVPPAPWFDLRGRMTEIDRTPARPAARPLRFRPQWTAVAAAVLLAVVTTYWFSAQRVTAAELLRKAADREPAGGLSRASIRISARSGSIVRPAVWRQSAAARMTSSADSLRALFESANYSWENPLSARSFSTWRQSLRDGQDKVVKLQGADGLSSWEIRTQTGSGTLLEVRLALRIPDLHATRGTLRFRDNELVEITEIPERLTDPPAPPAQIAESPTVPPAAGPIAPGEELQVWAALRRINADLGEPIAVERDSSANTIVVTALGLSQERRRVLENAMSGLPRVQLRFRDPQPVRESSRSLLSESANPPPLQPRLESQLGSRSLAEEFTDRILEASESSLLRAHAIRELSRHFPPETESQLTAQDRALLNSLLTEHLAGLHDASQRVLSEARQITAQTTPPPQIPARSWQAHAQSMVAAIERVDQALTKLLAVGGSAADQQALIVELERDLARMQAEIAAAETR